ncbi:MAG: sensor histidine kinase [Gammaproteobacteria bacterium]|nr:sensor histidine kinase [Gammaproteobacteria bacterium]
MKPVRMHYPWLSLLAAALVVGWQWLLLNPAALSIDLAPPLARVDYLWLALLLLLLAVIFDMRLFFRARTRYRDQLALYRDQIADLFDSKRQLGARARTYSDHADKLKMFISERLLEYIEYDEKFLHFKNIASEVRHNGVISYDKAQTALRLAQLNCAEGEQRQFNEAGDALLYLWDLLDLATTDNIALHVTNRIYDCEEHYFQSQLKQPGNASAAPFQPTFRMSQAIRRALLPITEDADALGLNGDWPKSGVYVDDEFKILLRTDCDLLGNVNHMVLLIENLLNNALYYSQQKINRQRHNRVALSFAHRAGEAVCKVYNRGPRIKDDEKDKIYQLGFSSRRIREHHGKGLGLYFVHEIARGFEAGIAFENIENRAQSVSLSVKLSNGEVQSQRIGIVDIDGKPLCQLLDSSGQVSTRHEWSYPAPIASIEVSPGKASKPQLISDLAIGEDSRHLDASEPLRAHWQLDIKNGKRSAKLIFMPLDVRGVEFVLRIPTASSRLDNQD